MVTERCRFGRCGRLVAGIRPERSAHLLELSCDFPGPLSELVCRQSHCRVFRGFYSTSMDSTQWNYYRSIGFGRPIRSLGRRAASITCLTPTGPRGECLREGLVGTWYPAFQPSPWCTAAQISAEVRSRKAPRRLNNSAMLAALSSAEAAIRSESQGH